MPWPAGNHSHIPLQTLQIRTSKTLSEHGYCVLEAGDGRQALQREAEYDGKIHLLITNLDMPGIRGHELAFQLKAKRPDIKVLIVSGDGESEFPPEARSHDVALLKPVDSKSLLSTVAGLLKDRGNV